MNSNDSIKHLFEAQCIIVYHNAIPYSRYEVFKMYFCLLYVSFLSVYAQECRVEKGDIDDEGSVVKVDIEEENGERKQENERRIPCNFMNGTI